MIKWIIVFTTLSLLTACSSKPKPNYDVTTLQSISYALMDLADKKRQEENYQQALLLYQEADKYAGRRNDKYLLGLSKLKQAAIHIKTEAFKLAEANLSEVRGIATFEEAKLEAPLMFLQAEYWANTKELEKSKNLYIQLKQRFQSDPIRSAYYQIGWWRYEPKSLTTEQARALVNRVEQAKLDGTLENIEIYSFVLLKFTEHKLKNKDDDAEALGLRTVKHFTQLEQSRKVLRLYEMMSLYAREKSDLEKAKYYDAQALRIKNLLL